MGKITNLFDKLAGQSVYIDTNLFIYFLDQNPKFFSIAVSILEAIESDHFVAYTGDITVAETLVKPYQTDNALMVASIKAFFATDNFISIVSHDSAIFDLAAQIRAKNRMKFPDALHFATAIKTGCHFFISNDTGFRTTDTIKVILINDLLS
jgi:predicted nucleic acid-binding protein